MGLIKLQVLRSTLSKVNRALSLLGMAILAAMMFLTAADVIGRYVLNSPVIGSLELTQFMMALTVAFGLAYTGIQKGHIDLDIVVNRLHPRSRAVIKAITTLTGVGLYALITWRAALYGESLRTGHFVSQSLSIPLFPFAYLMAMGSALLCLVFIIDFLGHLADIISGTRVWLWSVLILVVFLVVAFLSAPAWYQGLKGEVSPVTAGVISFIVLIPLLFSGMLIGVVMALLGFIGLFYIVGGSPALTNLGTTYYSTASSYSMTVIPLFVLMGLFCFHGGLTKGLYYTAYRWLGHLPGGLAIATIGGCAGFAAVSGSSIASTATWGAVSLPEMKKYNYDSALATGCIAAGGCLGILIPPSIIMAVYGILTDVSIGKLFIAGFIPGIIETILFAIVIYAECKQNPLLGPPGKSSSWKDRIVSLKHTWSTLLLFLLAIGGLYVGIFTPTEAAGVGAFGAFIIAVGTRRLTWKHFIDSLAETLKTTAMVFFMLIGANIYGYFLAVSRLPQLMSDAIVGVSLNRYVVMVAIILLYVFLGCIIAAMAAVVLTVPIFFPVVTALGFDPIWFGIIIVLVVETGQLTPPVGINVFVIHGIAKDVPMYTVFRGILPFFYAELFLIALLLIFPSIATVLPSLMK